MTSITLSAPRVGTRPAPPRPSPNALPPGWEQGLDAKRPAIAQKLSGSRWEATKKAVIADMNTFLQDPANAGKDPNKALEASLQKQATSQVLTQMQFDYFDKKMMERCKELQQDMWSDG